MESFSAPLIRHLLLPHRHEGSIVANVGIKRRKRRAKQDVGGLQLLQISLVCGSRTLQGHGATGKVVGEKIVQRAAMMKLRFR
jgi:hypothetical protein